MSRLHETVVWVAAPLDTLGGPRGFHKLTHFWHSPERAAVIASGMAQFPGVRAEVVECVIMTRERYEELCCACDSRSAGAAEDL